MPAAATPIDPRLTEPHVSNRVYLGFLAFLSERYGREATRAAVADCGIPFSYLEDENGWVSLEYTSLFADAVMRHLAGAEPPLAYEHPAWDLWRLAGHYAMIDDQPARVVATVRALASPAMVYRRVPGLVSRLNHVTLMEVTDQGRGFAVIRARPRAGAPPDLPSYCWSRRGFLEAIPALWGYPMAQLTHLRCIHDSRNPADACEYLIRYQDRKMAPWLWVGLRLTPWLGAGALIGGLHFAGQMAVGGAVGLLVGLAVEGWLRLGAANRRYVAHNERFISLIEDTDSRYADLWGEREELRRTALANRKISGYLAHDLVEQIMENPEIELSLGGRRVRAAVLFTDIVGFTPRCADSAPEDVIRELNTFFGHVDPLVAEHGGVIDKRLGDGLMLVFVSHTTDEDVSGAEARAVACGLAILAVLPRCNADLAAAGSAPMELRVGLAAGELVQGNLGSAVRMEHTVIGDTVNLASRLEGQARPGHLLMLAELATHAPAGTIKSEARTISVKELERPIMVVEARPEGD